MTIWELIKEYLVGVFWSLVSFAAFCVASKLAMYLSQIPKVSPGESLFYDVYNIVFEFAGLFFLALGLVAFIAINIMLFVKFMRDLWEYLN